MFSFLLRAPALALALLAFAAHAEPLSFEQALSLAAQRSEAARASRAAAQSATESSRAAGQLPDPMLHAGIDSLPATGPDRFNASRDFMTMKRIGISQEWVPADKRAARAAASTAMAERDAVRARAAESAARLQAANAYLDAWYADAALQLTTQNEHHVHEELAAARGRLAAAAGSSAEVLQLASAQGLAEDESDEARQQQASAFVALQRWVGIRPDAVGALPTVNAPLEQDFIERSPEVVALQREVEVARRNAAVTAKERTANWTWQVSYAQRSGYSDMVSIGVNIPLQIAPEQRQDRQTAAQLALVDQAEAQLAEASRAALGEYQTLASDAARLAQRIERFRTSVIVLAQQRTQAALAAYRSSQSPLSALFEARHMEVEVRRKLLALQRDLAKVQIQLAFKPLALGDVQ